MSSTSNNAEEMRELLAALREDVITESQSDRLTQLLRDDRDARRMYIHSMAMVANIRGRMTNRQIVAEMPTNDLPLDTDSQTTNSPFPSLAPLLSRPSSPFVGGPVFSYMVASVVLCLMLLSAWAYKITRHQEIVDIPPNVKKEFIVVGHITGMKDCVWPEDALGTMVGASVPLGREYALSSGLIQITYTSGAKVILEGPCTYKADSTTGGYLAIGKLTARVDAAKPQVVNTQSTATSHQPLATNPRPPVPSLSTPLFTISTPTAIVTDLGTEFGVEVSLNGGTEVHVFQGKVETENLVCRKIGKYRSLVTEGNAVQVEPNNKIIAVKACAADRFVRGLFPAQRSRPSNKYRKAVLADKPLGYWPLEEPPGARTFRDLSGNGFHGAAMGTVRAGVAGPPAGQSRAVALNGSGYIDIGRQDRFALGNGFTIEAWVYIDGLEWTENIHNNARIFSVGSGEDRYQSTGWTLGYKVKQDSRKPYCVFARYGVSSDKIDGAEIPFVRWTHLGLVFDGENTVRLYLDGTERGTKDLGNPALKGPSWVAIGWGANLGGTYWRGRLAHVAVYTKALDKKCIQNHFRSTCDHKQGVSGH